MLLGGVFGGRLHARVGACWAAVFNAFHGRLWALFCGSCGRTWALVGGSVARGLHGMWELVCAQLTFGCLDVAVISTRVNHVGMFLRRAEPASTLGAWAGLGSGFFGVFPVLSRGFKFFFWRAEGPHKPRPHMKFAGIWATKNGTQRLSFEELTWNPLALIFVGWTRVVENDPAE